LGGLLGRLAWWWEDNYKGFFFCFSKVIQDVRRLQRLFFPFIFGGIISLVKRRLVLLEEKLRGSDASENG
jgi:hypothetical protein